MKPTVIFAAICIILLGTGSANAELGSHQELGGVNWLRSFDRAITSSRETGKPLFILFQEVPGCATCVNYGRQVLSHPLVVEAIETHFVPLAIFNNRGGEDGRVMKRFKEPSWNNPVVRIIDYRETPLAPRLAGDYTIAGTTATMIEALEQSHIPVPEYLRILHDENSPFLYPEKAVFSTFCFWSGEIELGKIEGVVGTRAGFMHGHEAVELQFNSEVISYGELLRKAKRTGVVRNAYVLSEDQKKRALQQLEDARVAWATTFHPDRQIKYYLSQTPYRYLPLTSMQAIRVNQALAERKNPDVFLSPGQLTMLAYITEHPYLNWQRRTDDTDFTSSWSKVAGLIASGE